MVDECAYFRCLAETSAVDPVTVATARVPGVTSLKLSGRSLKQFAIGDTARNNQTERPGTRISQTETPELTRWSVATTVIPTDFLSIMTTYIR